MVSQVAAGMIGTMKGTIITQPRRELKLVFAKAYSGNPGRGE